MDSPDDLSLWSLHGYCLGARETPHATVRQGDNGRLLFAAEDWCGPEDLARLGLSPRPEQIERLVDFGLIERQGEAQRSLVPRLGPALALFIMTWDNLINVFVQPWVGAKSDQTWNRFGRRKPWILLGVPVALVGFTLIPFAQTAVAIAAFILITNFGMALFRSPTVAWLGDLYQPDDRSKANGIINMMGGVGGLLAFFGGGFLFEHFSAIDPELGRMAPFIGGGILLLAAARGPRPPAIYNVTARANDAYDAAFETFAPRRGWGERALGLGLADPPPFWVDLQLDRPEVAAWINARGIPLRPSATRLCHWSFYTRPGAFEVYQAILRRHPGWDVASLRAAPCLAAQEPRWSRFAPRLRRPALPVGDVAGLGRA